MEKPTSGFLKLYRKFFLSDFWTLRSFGNLGKAGCVIAGNGNLHAENKKRIQYDIRRISKRSREV